jgi:hypothetical protein
MLESLPARRISALRVFTLLRAFLRPRPERLPAIRWRLRGLRRKPWEIFCDILVHVEGGAVLMEGDIDDLKLILQQDLQNRFFVMWSRTISGASNPSRTHTILRQSWDKVLGCSGTFRWTEVHMHNPRVIMHEDRMFQVPRMEGSECQVAVEFNGSCPSALHPIRSGQY